MTRRIFLPILFLLMFGTARFGMGQNIALVHAKIYPSPSEPPINDGAIFISKGKITQVSASRDLKLPWLARRVTVIDCSGRVIVAGFWNSHVHIFTPELLNALNRADAELNSQLERMLTRWGFTTVFDVASILDNTNEIRQRIATGRVRGPRILTVGEPFYPKDGTPIYVKQFLHENHVPSAEIQSEEQALGRVRSQLTHGADGIKVFTGAITATGVLPFPMEIAKAIVAQAHRANKPVFSHPSNMEGLEIAVQSGMDVLAHTAPMSGDWTAEFARKLVARKIALIPTLTLFDVEAKKARVSAEENAMWIRQAQQELRAFENAGGQVLFGTDVGYIEQADTTEEFKLMAVAGMTYEQILAALTVNPATRFGYANRSGRIAKGFDADLVVLDGDPASDVTAFSKVAQVFRVGISIYRRHAERSNLATSPADQNRQREKSPRKHSE